MVFFSNIPPRILSPQIPLIHLSSTNMNIFGSTNSKTPRHLARKASVQPGTIATIYWEWIGRKSFYMDPNISEQFCNYPKDFVSERLRHNTLLGTIDLSCELMDFLLAIIVQANRTICLGTVRLFSHRVYSGLDALVVHPQFTLMSLNLGGQRKKSKRKTSKEGIKHGDERSGRT